MRDDRSQGVGGAGGSLFALAGGMGFAWPDGQKRQTPTEELGGFDRSYPVYRLVAPEVDQFDRCFV